MHDELPELSMPPDEQAHLAAETFRMLADPTRIKLLWALLQGESSVTCLAELAGVRPTSVSQHLAKMRLAGLVRGRREGTFIYYKVADAHVHALLAEVLSHADHTDRELGAEANHKHRLAETAQSRRSTPRAQVDLLVFGGSGLQSGVDLEDKEALAALRDKEGQPGDRATP